MKKFLSGIISIIITTSISLSANAGQGKYNRAIEKAFNNSTISKSSVHVSFKQIGSKKKMYELNSDTPTPAGSIQKIVTYTVAKDKLGKDYNFSTKLYKNENDNYFLVLGADPFFTNTDFKSLITGVNTKINSLSVDSSIVDDKEWGEGWQWDDDLNPLMPKYSAFNIDGNLIKVFVIPTINGAPANIQTNIYYPYTFENHTITQAKGQTNITFTKHNHISPNVITVSGTLDKTIIKEVPVNNPKRYFKIRLEENLRKQKTPYYDEVKFETIPKEGFELVNEIKHPMTQISKSILKDSNNLVAESFFKVASYGLSNNSETENLSGTTEKSIELFNEYCKKAGIDNSEVRIVDGSGVSKNNLLTAKFMTNFLDYNAESDLKNNLPTAGEGTLTDRMLYLKNKLHAKTGTLSNVSAITGYLETKKKNQYAFCIIINNPKATDSDMKMLEEYILRYAYLKM